MTEMEVRKLFSKNLKRIRDKQDISQLALANLTGLTHTFINDIENCKKWISPDTIARLCGALKANPFEFFLPDKDLEESDNRVLSTYVDDLSSIIIKSVNDFKARYLNDDPDKDSSSDNDKDDDNGEK